MQEPSPNAGPGTNTSLSFTPPPEPIFYRLRDMIACLKLSRSSIYRLLANDPTFPKPYRLVGRVLAWRRDEIEAWANARTRVEWIEQ